VQNLSVSGFPAFGSDTGGYRGDDQDKELLVRWAEHTALTPIMQLGGGDHHNVWDMTVYDAETLDVYRRYARLHTRLFPLWYSLAHEATGGGCPPIEPLGLWAPDDPDAHAWWDEYVVAAGDAGVLLVAPVREDGARERVVHLPATRWVHWSTGEEIEGPADVTVDAPLDSLPLFIGRGAIVPMIADDVDTFVGTIHDEFVTLEERDDQLFVRIFPGEVPAAFALFEGGLLEAEDSGSSVEVVVSRGDWFTRWVLEILWEARSVPAPDPPSSVSLDGTTLAEQSDSLLVASGGCDGCWHYLEATGTLLVSIASPGTVTAR
jgi:hypothetical protein